MVLKNKQRGGVNDLLELDLFEISIAPGEINPATRFVSLKAAAQLEQAELRRQCDEVLGGLAGREVMPTQAELRRKSDELAIEVALGEPLHEFVARHRAETRDIPSHAELRRKSDDLAIEVALGQPLAELRKQVTETETESIPTDAELRAKCRELGFAVPTPRRRKAPPYDLEAVRAEARDTIIAQLRGV
jgi:hypothetical protein